MREKTYSGIDYFRIIAASLVVAIHTSPLTSINSTADFILTRVIARVAVPFFFMTSGFFLFHRAGDEGKRLAVFLKKTAMLYAIAILLYLPLNLYHGIPEEWAYLPNLLKNIFFDGTYLHLWYLPAAIFGAAISWALLKNFKEKGALAIGLFLYIIGLFGDSYYGFAARIPAFQAFYHAVFEFCRYTRNGLFFAPVFFILGALVAKRQKRYGLKTCMTGLWVSMALMIAEGLLLRGWEAQRHDSMYIMLLPCMIFLFQSLLLWNGRAVKSLRGISATVYIIHPMMIALVYKFAAVTNLQWLGHNSIARFSSVALASLAAAVLSIIFLQKMRLWKVPLRQACMDRAWAEINLENLRQNVRILQKYLPEKCDVMAVVKANAYGHGDIEISKTLSRIGVKAFAVATIDEGIRLRQNGIRGEILILGHTDPQRAAELRRYHLSQTVVDAQYAATLSNTRKSVQVHIKVDTGMHRLGESYDHAQEIVPMFYYRHLKVNGIFTHLCVSDSMKADDINFTKLQIKRFLCLLEELRSHQIEIPKTHIQSSYGVLNYPEIWCDYARLGLALYGASDKGKQNIDLKPVLSLKARVALTRTIAAGESVGYGRRFTAGRNTRIAVLPIGYADGIPRNLGNKQSFILLHGRRAPIIGSICMDQLMVDVTNIPNIKCGDTATLIGCDGTDEITVKEIAANAGTIPNELLSRLSNRLERIYI